MGRFIVVPENLSVEDIMKMNLTMKKMLNILKHHSSDIDKIIGQSSTYICKSILDMKWKSPWSIHSSDVDIRSFPIPEGFKRLLMIVLTTDVSNPSQRILNRVYSFSPEIVYAVTCGKTKPPKASSFFVWCT